MYVELVFKGPSPPFFSYAHGTAPNHNVAGAVGSGSTRLVCVGACARSRTMHRTTKQGLRRRPSKEGAVQVSPRRHGRPPWRLHFEGAQTHLWHLGNNVHHGTSSTNWQVPVDCRVPVDCATHPQPSPTLTKQHGLKRVMGGN